VGLGLEELRGVDPALWTPDPLLFGVSCALLFAGYAVSAAIWGRMVRDLGGPRLGIAESVRLFMIANVGRYVPGKVWQIAGLAALARGRGVSATVATGAAILGQGIALVAATIVGLGAVLAGPPELAEWGRVAAGFGVAAVAVGLFPPVFRTVSALWFRLASAVPPEELRSRHALVWLVLYGLNWVLYALAFWVLARSVGVTAPPVPVASAFAAAWVLGWIMIFAPAGIGVREGFMVALLTPHMGPGPAGALAVLSRVWATAVELIPAAVFWGRHLAGAESEVDRGEEG
jgi:uncharacterized membrane protein YbhN (UPF0104 family)